jgi:hypothetical protein
MAYMNSGELESCINSLFFLLLIISNESGSIQFVGYFIPDVGCFSVVASPSEQRRTSDGQRIGPDESQQNGGLNPAQFGAATADATEGPVPVCWAVHDQLTSPQGQRRQCRNRSDSYTCPTPTHATPFRQDKIDIVFNIRMKDAPVVDMIMA